MEGNRQNRIPAKDELAAGSLVSLYVNGKRHEKEILERRPDHLLLGALGDAGEPPLYQQAACLVQSLSDERTLLAVMRFEEGRGRGRGRQDLFRLIPGGYMYLWPGLNSLAMHHWVPLQVYAPHEPSQILLDDLAFLFALTETQASMMIPIPLPPGSFAECSFPLGGEQLSLRTVLTRCEDLDGGAGYRGHFMLIDQWLRPKLREFLLDEQAKRLQAAVI